MIYLLFAVPQRPRLKKRYHDRVEKVREYLGTIRDFDDLISLQSMFLHFGPRALKQGLEEFRGCEEK